MPKTCKVCGETEGEPLGHSWNEATCTVPKTCKVCGETEGEPLGHSWNEATCTVPKTCEICGETEGEALGHSWIEATMTEPKTCEVCGETEGEAKIILRDRTDEDLMNLCAAISVELQSRNRIESFQVPVGSWTVGKHLKSGLYSIGVQDKNHLSYFDLTLSQFGGITVRASVDSPAGTIDHIWLQDGDTIEIKSDAVIISAGVPFPQYEQADPEAVSDDLTLFTDAELTSLYHMIIPMLQGKTLLPLDLPGGIWIAGEDFPAGSYDAVAYLKDDRGNYGFSVYEDAANFGYNWGIVQLYGYGSEEKTALNLDIPDGGIVFVNGCRAKLSTSNPDVFFGPA